MQVILEIAAGPETGRRLTLEAGRSLTVGRTERADVVLADDPAVSSVHFLLDNGGRDCAIEDLQSRNGTFVNGRRITTRTPLKDEDQILAGQSTFLVEFVKATGPSPRAPASAAAGPGFARTSYTAEPCDSGLTTSCHGSSRTYLGNMR